MALFTDACTGHSAIMSKRFPENWDFATYSPFHFRPRRILLCVVWVYFYINHIYNWKKYWIDFIYIVFTYFAQCISYYTHSFTKKHSLRHQMPDLNCSEKLPSCPILLGCCNHYHDQITGIHSILCSTANSTWPQLRHFAYCTFSKIFCIG